MLKVSVPSPCEITLQQAHSTCLCLPCKGQHPFQSAGQMGIQALPMMHLEWAERSQVEVLRTIQEWMASRT